MIEYYETDKNNRQKWYPAKWIDPSNILSETNESTNVT